MKRILPCICIVAAFVSALPMVISPGLMASKEQYPAATEQAEATAQDTLQEDTAGIEAEETEDEYFHIETDEDEFGGANIEDFTTAEREPVTEEITTEEITTEEITTEEMTTEEITTEETTEETTVQQLLPDGKNFIACDAEYVRVYDRDTEKYTYMLLGEYLVGVVAAEMPSYFNIEALKAQAIACRTFTLYRMENMAGNYHSSYHGDEGAEVCTFSGHCQAYMSYSEAYARWGKEYADAIFDVSRQAVLETSGMVVTYSGLLIDAVYHSSSYKSTDSIVNVWTADYPYLVGVETPETPENLSNLVSEKVYSSSEFAERLKDFDKSAVLSSDPSGWIEGITKNAFGKVGEAHIGGITLTGQNMKSVFSLRNTHFTCEYDSASDEFTFTVYGNGHNVGLSQYGSNIYAKMGYDAEWIVTHYYTDTEIVIYK